MSSSASAGCSRRGQRPRDHPEGREVRGLLALVDGADTQPALVRGRLLARRDPVVAGGRDRDEAGGQRPDRSVDLVAAGAPSTGTLPPSERLMTFAPWSVAQLMPSATVSASPFPSLSSTRTGRIFAPGATDSTPTPLPLERVDHAGDVGAVPVAVLGRVVVVDEVVSGVTWPARSAWSAFTPVSTTATTAPAPVLVACAPSAPIMSRPHWCERSGSAACAVAGAAKHRRMRATSPARMAIATNLKRRRRASAGSQGD